MEPPWERGERDSVKKAKPPPAPPVASLTDPLLREILRRLPDMASLLSAALACKSWARVASDPAVFRRFLSLRRPPLVGFLLTDRGAKPVPIHDPDVCFITASPRHPELASAASNGDFRFARHPGIDDGNPRHDNGWRLRGCDGGRVLLGRGRYGDDLVVYDPLDRTAIFFGKPHLPLGHHWYNVRYAIVAAEVDDSFQVVAIQHGEEETAAVFSSRTREWAMIDWGTVRCRFAWPYNDGIAAGQFVYWPGNTKDENKEEILVLDMKTMAWSVITAPFLPGESYCLADMAEHGGLCIVSSKEQCVKLWVRDSNGGWVVKKEFSLLHQFGYLKKLRRDEWMKRVMISVTEVQLFHSSCGWHPYLCQMRTRNFKMLDSMWKVKLLLVTLVRSYLNYSVRASSTHPFEMELQLLIGVMFSSCKYESDFLLLRNSLPCNLNLVTFPVMRPV